MGWIGRKGKFCESIMDRFQVHLHRHVSPSELAESGLEFFRPFEAFDGCRILPCGIEPDEFLMKNRCVVDGTHLDGGDDEQGGGVFEFGGR